MILSCSLSFLPISLSVFLLLSLPPLVGSPPTLSPCLPYPGCPPLSPSLSPFLSLTVTTFTPSHPWWQYRVATEITVHVIPTSTSWCDHERHERHKRLRKDTFMLHEIHAEYTLASPDCHRRNLSARLGNTSSIDGGTKTGGLLNYATHGSRSILLLVTWYSFLFLCSNCASMILLKISWRRKDRSRNWFMRDMWHGMHKRCTRKYLSGVHWPVEFAIRRSSTRISTDEVNV